MPQLPDFISPGAPEPAQQPFANPEEASVVGAAGVRGGEQLESAVNEWSQRYFAARRQAIAADAVASASKQLDDLEFTSSKIPDRQKAVATFEQGAGISTDAQGNVQLAPGGVIQKTLDGIDDPVAKAYAQGEITKLAIAHRAETQLKSFALESSTRVGQLDQNLFQFANSASAAQTPQLRAMLTDNANAAIQGAVAAGWLRPEEGAARAIQFRGQLASADADSYIRTASQQVAVGRLTPLDISNYISDPSHFIGMTIEQRQQKADEAVRLGRTIVAMQTSAQAHDDAVAERQLKASQASNAASLIAGVSTGGPGAAQQVDAGKLAGLVKTGIINEAGFSAVLAAQSRAEAGRDDAGTVMDLYRRFGNGEDVSNDALEAYAENKLSRQTMLDLGKAQAERGKGADSAVDKQNFGSLKTALNGYAIEQGMFQGADKDERAELWTNAQREWTQRVSINHENSSAVLGDMLTRYVKAPGSIEGLPTPRLGAVSSTADVQRIAKLTQQAYDNKQLSPAQFDAEKQLLTQYALRFRAQEQAAAAAKSGPKPPSGAGSATAPSVDMEQ